MPVQSVVPEHAAKPSGNQLEFQQPLVRAPSLAVAGSASHGKGRQVILNPLGILLGYHGICGADLDFVTPKKSRLKDSGVSQQHHPERSQVYKTGLILACPYHSLCWEASWITAGLGLKQVGNCLLLGKWNCGGLLRGDW